MGYRFWKKKSAKSEVLEPGQRLSVRAGERASNQGQDPRRVERQVRSGGAGGATLLSNLSDLYDMYADVVPSS